MCHRKKKPDSFLWPYHKTPAYLRTNPYIKNGYRVNLSTLECFRSVLWWTNETLNIWSHIIGFVVFLCLLIYDVTVVYNKYHGTEDDALVVSFVLICFMMCMILSSLYHTLNCTSEKACMKWLAFDIFGISTSFFAIFLSGIYYGFWCPEYDLHRYIYCGLVCIVFAGAVAFLLTPKFLRDDWEWARVTLFTSWAASGIIPTVHWIYLYFGNTTGIVELFLPRIFTMYGICGLAVTVYVMKIPERLLPGRFDFVGASHQLWHLIIVIALVYWHQTGINYAQYRLKFGCGKDIVHQ
ncbi:Progestin and adipoQ receptor member 3 [Halocaridina rubra]|uniref:Progestin and adipoQ receptor member 3 n=1 Tax=Halocaridina rubra TaxID=373956 RepID=A0AAN8XSS0_HALRR